MIAALLAIASIMQAPLSIAPTPNMYVRVTDHKPNVGVTQTVYMGDKMLEQREGEYRECLVPKFDVEKKMNLGMARFVIKEGEPICKQRAAAKYYTPNYVNWFGGTDVRFVMDLAVKTEKNGALQICMTSMGVKSGCTSVDPSQVHFGPWFLYAKSALQQTVEYSGKSGNELKFVYSEYADGIARPAFTREFQIDLSEGSVLAYKGAIIEIERATSTQITYKVIRNFQS